MGWSAAVVAVVLVCGWFRLFGQIRSVQRLTVWVIDGIDSSL